MIEAIANAAGELYVRALKQLPPDVEQALRAAAERETNSRAKDILHTILRNIEVAQETDNLICQDTGTPIYFVRLGERFPVSPHQIVEAIRRGCEDATTRHSLRPNPVHPILRTLAGPNVGNGIPVIHSDFLDDSDRLEMLMVPKGSGSENQGFLKMLVPADGVAGIERFVLESVVNAGAMPCPPTVVGVGIGGTFDTCPQLAKRAIARPIGSRNADEQAARLEESLLDKINRLGIGPMGLGGDTTALAVHVEWNDTHISQLPVAVNIQCWAARRAKAVVDANGEVRWEDA